jgi:hypothetical protein
MSEQQSPKHNPGEGLFGWLGRQIGHVKKAVQTQVESEAEKQAQGDPENQVVYQKETVHEAPHPENPDLKLRRTVIDEVIVEPKKIQGE